MERVQLRGSLESLSVAILLLVATAGCDRVSQELGDLALRMQAAEERPADSDLVSVSSGAETRVYYQFTDDRGNVRFVERLADVPERWRDRVGILEMDSPPPLSPVDARKTRERRTANITTSSSSAAASDQPSVIIYYASWCPVCRKAKAWMDDNGIRYDMRDANRDDVKAELREKSGQGGIPVIDVDGRIMVGWSPGSFQSLMKRG